MWKNALALLGLMALRSGLAYSWYPEYENRMAYMRLRPEYGYGGEILMNLPDGEIVSLRELIGLGRTLRELQLDRRTVYPGYDPACPPGERLDAFGICTPGLIVRRNLVGDKHTLCAPGWIMNDKGECEQDLTRRRVIEGPRKGCPKGTLPDKQGKCKRVYWGRNIINPPMFCPEGQKPDQNGVCREVNRRFIIDPPPRCPEGQRPDPTGRCREVIDV
ncbi:hypothetical protein KM043_010165 [Ampulex compressa]|nr:hypothetical protein KM043_010165 [Ampulex compressa]